MIVHVTAVAAAVVLFSSGFDMIRRARVAGRRGVRDLATGTAEVAVAVALGSSVALHWTSPLRVSATATLCLFLAYLCRIAWQFSNGDTGLCGCGAVEAPVSAPLVFRNALLAGNAAILWLPVVSTDDFAFLGGQLEWEAWFAAAATGAVIFAVPAAFAFSSTERARLAQDNRWS